MSKNRAYLFVLFLLTALVGCQKKEVVYEEEGAASRADSIMEKENGGSLTNTLGIGDEQIWEESIPLENAMIAVEAEVVVPDVSELCTLEVSQYYYTAEDKQRVAEYFLDSIKVNREKVQTKESISRDMQTGDALLEQAADDVSPDESYMAAVQREQKRLENLLGNAPDASSVTEDVDGYEQDNYLGTRNGIPYSLDFNICQEKNTSSWELRAQEGDSFITEGEKWQGFIQFANETMPVAEVKENLCDKEKAVGQATKIVEELGFNLCVAEIYDVYWGLEDNRTECNGYQIVMARQIGGVAVDNVSYTRSYNENTYLDAETMKQAYDKENIIITLNDKGIYSVECYGILSEGELSGPVRLLGYDQIKEIFRQELNKFKTGVVDITFRGLELTYIRISNPERRDTYMYIPAWRLAQWGVDNRYATALVSSDIWINALDGNRIDLEEEGAISYTVLDIQDESYRLEE
ncbi:MAG: DUF6034 family protein [Clostridium sp.]|nr:DUF6034 family protein [Clostridium sp.]